MIACRGKKDCWNHATLDRPICSQCIEEGYGDGKQPPIEKCIMEGCNNANIAGSKYCWAHKRDAGK